MGQKILISGGAGFLGINAVRYLLSKGVTDIVSLDIADFEYPEKNTITAVKGDIRDKKVVERVMAGVSIVIHAAAALPLYTKEDIYSTDVNGTRIMLEEAYKRGVERFIQISSTAVYGVPDHHPIDEHDRLYGVGDYGKAKILAEEECLQYRRQGWCVPILRPKSFVGPERLGVFALLYEWAKDGKNFPILGKGTNRYQLLDVEDLCEAIFLCMTKEKALVNDTFNIGAKIFTTIREDFQAVLDEAGYGKKIVSLPAGPAILALKLLEWAHLSPLYQWIYETVAKDSFVATDRVEKRLGFMPRYSNKDALIRNYRWYMDNFEKFSAMTGLSHKVPWQQGALTLAKRLF
ncbi:MAG: NAD-dependent epimerase/dehydratase family protein [Candidatus Omnitrophica bacterium]|nr:NAD-dependent epimerase/dehydratase family protein [Candidatus Omnitrophota bacterium]